MPGLGRDEELGFDSADLPEVGYNRGVDAVGLREYALGARKVPELVGVDDGIGDARDTGRHGEGGSYPPAASMTTM